MTRFSYLRSGGGKLNDRRTDEQRKATILYVVATDSFMSGWGEARGGKSYYAVACPDWTVAEDVERRMRTRSEFKRVRICSKPTRTRTGDHLSISWHEEFTYGK